MAAPIVGLCGFAQSGKDTLADLLQKKYGYEKRAFADNIRKCLLALNPIVKVETPSKAVRLSEIVESQGWETAKQNSEVRQLLQRMGTEAGREIFGQNFWIEQTLAQPWAGTLIVSDVRFPNEAVAIQRSGGLIIRIVRDGVKSVNEHFSEIAYTGSDFTLENNGSPEELLKKYEETIRYWNRMNGIRCDD